MDKINTKMNFGLRYSKAMLGMALGVFVCLRPGQVSAQQTHCGTDEHHKYLEQTHPEIIQNKAKFEQSVEAYNRAPKNRATPKYIIPVVFHIMHNGGAENISKQRCIESIQLLNLDYSLSNADTANIRAPFKPFMANMEVEFRLATKDPNGNCTDGITRTVTELTDFGNDDVKLLDAWPSERYLNIWVVSSIASGDAPGTILGYAQFPWAGLSRTDGVIVRADEVGNTGINKNRTLTHEIGHWLGLYHPFQGGCDGGDEVEDTPPVASTFTNANCPVNGNSCTNDVPDMMDMWENYMDYSRGTCQALFTKGQKARIEASINTQRFEIFSQANLIRTGAINPLSGCAPKASFKPESYRVCDGKSLQFIDLSYQYTGSLTYNWSFDGGTPATATTANPSVTYAAPGVYGVSLIVTNNAGKSDTMSKRLLVSVGAAAWTNPESLAEGFEAGQLPQGWYYGGNTGNPWEVTASASYAGSKSLKITNGSKYDGGVYNVSTTAVDASGASPAIEFKYAFVQRTVTNSTNGTQDRLSLKYSTDCGKTWITIWAKSGDQLSTVPNAPKLVYDFVPPTSDYWGSISQSLSSINAIARRNIMFRWEFVSNGGNNFYLDQINLNQTLSAGQSGSNVSLRIAPNPATDAINLSGSFSNSDNNATVRITNSLGQDMGILYKGKVQGRVSLNLNLPKGLATGIYTVSVETANGIYTEKLIIE